MDVRDTARLYLVQVPVAPLQITSNGITASLFTKLSGITHTMLLQSWGFAPRPKKSPSDPDVFKADPPPGLTSCNGFVALYCSVNKFSTDPNKTLGRFNLEKHLTNLNKSFAWIPSKAGARPKFGDVFELEGRLHIGISLDFIGNIWQTAEGGQGGSTLKFDIIKRKDATQSGDVVITNKGEKLKGWVDLDLFVNGPPPTTVPDWLLGWWSIPWRGRTFFYFFDAGFKASWTFQKPVTDAFAPLNFDDTATLTIDSQTSITLKWSETGSVEKFTRTGTEDIMVGFWNGVEPLVATKMF